MGSLVGLIAIALVLIAVIVTPKLELLGITRASQWAFAVMLISIASYLTVVAGLFFGDQLHGVNYAAPLIIVRFLALGGAAWFLVAGVRCNGKRWPGTKL